MMCKEEGRQFQLASATEAMGQCFQGKGVGAKHNFSNEKSVDRKTTKTVTDEWKFNWHEQILLSFNKPLRSVALLEDLYLLGAWSGVKCNRYILIIFFFSFLFFKS